MRLGEEVGSPDGYYDWNGDRSIHESWDRYGNRGLDGRRLFSCSRCPRDGDGDRSIRESWNCSGNRDLDGRRLVS